MDKIESGFPNTPVLQDSEGGMCVCLMPEIVTTVTDTTARTAVGIGLMRIADNDEIIPLGKIPVSLWMIDDMDDSTTDDDPKTVMRICTQGRDLQGGSNVKYKSTSYPVLLILKSD
jgi:hypothetical protein